MEGSLEGSHGDRVRLEDGRGHRGGLHHYPGLNYPRRSLAQHYAPLGMDPALVKAHDGLDAVMDKIMGAPRRCRTELERQELLFARYAQLTS